jgi:hypothetical protein
VDQQQTVRSLVEPHLEGVLEVERVPWGKALMEGQLHGRYLPEMRNVP